MRVRLISAVAFLMLLSWTRNVVVLHGQEEGWTSIGPESGTVYALAIDPRDHSVVYAGTNGGVFKSIDSGVHWSPVNAGLPMPRSAENNGGPYVYSLAIDPKHAKTILNVGIVKAFGKQDLEGARQAAAARIHLVHIGSSLPGRQMPCRCFFVHVADPILEGCGALKDKIE